MTLSWKCCSCSSDFNRCRKREAWLYNRILRRMYIFNMNSCVVGIILKRLLPIAAVLLISLCVVRWSVLQSGTYNDVILEEKESTAATHLVKGETLCPPNQKNPENDSPRLKVVQQDTPCVRCPGGRSFSDGRWYNFSTPSIRIFLFSATFDDRSGLGSDAVIRIISVADPVEKWNLRCLLHHDNGVRMSPVDPIPMKIGHGWKVDGKKLQEYIYTCSAENIVPYAVSIIGNERVEHLEKLVVDLKESGGKNQKESEKEKTLEPSNRPTVSSCMTVQISARPEKREDFAICVPVAYRSVDPYRLIEWMELQRILGVTRVGVAHIGFNQSSLRVLEHYASQGFLDLQRTEPLTLTPDTHHRRLHSTTTINYCVLRNMYRFNWILVLDFDEFILPRRQRNLRDFVQYLDTKNSVKGQQPATAYVFRNNYFFLDFKPDDSISPYLTVLRHRDKVPVSGKGYAIKSIINPRACDHMHNHFCWGRLEGYSKYDNNVEVDIDDGLSQHYKRCHFAQKECLRMMKNVTRDDVMLRFRDELTSRVREKVKEIMGHEL